MAEEHTRSRITCTSLNFIFSTSQMPGEEDSGLGGHLFSTVIFFFFFSLAFLSVVSSIFLTRMYVLSHKECDLLHQRIDYLQKY